ncbi:MAG: hypothetical protein JWR58_4965 [Pseudonocardia sp.]|nr:hypothetical protein [Pseudonocardia sp.]
MSPTSLVPGASAPKSRATRSGIGPVSPATVAVGLVGVGEDPFDEGCQAGTAAGGRRRRPIAPLVIARSGHSDPGPHLHDEYCAFSASVNTNFALTDTPGRRRLLLSPGTRLSSSAHVLLVRALEVAPVPRSTAAVPRRQARPGTCSPSSQGCFVHVDLAGDRSDWPGRLGHHLHGLVFELWRELSARSRIDHPPFRAEPYCARIRNLGGSPALWRRGDGSTPAGWSRPSTTCTPSPGYCSPTGPSTVRSRGLIVSVSVRDIRS